MMLNSSYFFYMLFSGKCTHNHSPLPKNGKMENQDLTNRKCSVQIVCMHEVTLTPALSQRADFKDQIIFKSNLMHQDYDIPF